MRAGMAKAAPIATSTAALIPPAIQGRREAFAPPGDVPPQPAEVIAWVFVGAVCGPLDEAAAGRTAE